MSPVPATLAPNPDVLRQPFEDSLLLIHVDSGRFFKLNRTATRFWDLLCAGKDRQQIEECLGAEFAVPPQQLHDEMDVLIARLIQEKLVTRHGSN